MRLIDADTLREQFPEPNDWRDPERALVHITGIWAKIDNAPTIEPKVGEWIPVTERLPREYTRVIGYMAWKAMTTIEYQHGKWYSIDHLEPLPDEAVSHWMPLPKPPKEGD